MRRAAAAAVAALGAAACTLAEVVVPESEDVLVVEAVLRTDLAQQAILLHRSVRGRASAPEPGATVRVRGPDGRAVEFVETRAECVAGRELYPGPDALEVEATCYLGSEAGWRVLPGATYTLEVTTTRGERASARTTVPGDFALVGLPFTKRVDAGPPQPCTLPPRTQLPVRWTPAEGAWGYLAPLRLLGLRESLPPGVEAPDPLELLGLAVSASDTEIVLPAEFGVFDRFHLNQELLRILQQGLPERTRAELTIAAADRNYINGVRGGSFNPSGRVRISSVTGDAVGVFGSLVPLAAAVWAGPPVPELPPCAAG